MLNTALIYKILGSLLFLLGTLQAICAGIAFGYREDDVMSFLISTLFTCCCALVLKYLGRNADNNLSRPARDFNMVCVFTTWHGSLSDRWLHHQYY